MKHGPLAALFWAFALLPVFSLCAENKAESLHVLLQGAPAEELVALVEETGGEPTHELHIINAVGARMTREQLDKALESPLVERHMDDLGEDDPPKKDEDACKVRGHIELTIADQSIIWPLYNKREEAATWKSLELAWPAALGAITEVRLGDTALDKAMYKGQSGASATIRFSGEYAPTVAERVDLEVKFSAKDAGRQLRKLHQRDFDIEATFAGDCSTDLVRGYENNHLDFYYNAVAGVEPLHLQGIRGQGITVAVIDSGLWEHPALMKNTQGKQRVLARYDAITDTQGQEVLDESGHGTHMSSIIAHNGPTVRNGRETGSFKGVAPDADLVAVKVLDRKGRAHLLDIVRAVQWVVDNREKYNIRVLNLSFAQLPRWYYWEDPVNQAVMRAWATGITVVAAAGNDGPDTMTIGSPGNLPYVITVGAVTDSWTQETRDDDYIPDFSSRGPTESGHIKPDIVALGGHMTGLVHPDSDLALTSPEDILASGEYTSTGSSQSAALVSGIVALLLQLQPELSPDDIKCKLITSAEPAINHDGLLAYSPFAQGSGYVTAGRTVMLGETGCGNEDFDLAADIEGRDHFYGPALIDDEGNTSLEGHDQVISSEPSAKGLSDTRKWGVKDHMERVVSDGGQPPGTRNAAFDWAEMYGREKAKVERLASGAQAPSVEAQK